jgi:hypothetical protein
MTKPTVATEVHQALDVRLNLAPEIAFDFVDRLEELADLLDVALGQLLGLLVRGDACLFANLERRLLADAIEVRERVRDVLVVGKVYSCDTSHVCFLLRGLRRDG